MAVDEDDYDDYDDYDDDYDGGGDEGLSAEDKEQMREGTIKVREALGSFPATDEEIQDSLWHYYYDVAKTVSYLKSTVSLLPKVLILSIF